MNVEFERVYSRLRKFLAVFVPLLLFTGALWFLYVFSKKHSYLEIKNDLSDVSWQNLSLASMTTLASYFVLTGYDFLGFAYVKVKLSFLKIAPISMMAFSLNNSIGLAGLAGLAIRIRNYSKWNVTLGDILRVATFSTLTFWVGLLSVGGFALLTSSLDISEWVLIPPEAFRLLGACALAAVASYLILCGMKRAPFVFRETTLEWPVLPLAFSQL